MSKKILATFRCDPNKWQEFKTKSEADRRSASAILLQFIDWYLAGHNLPLNNSSSLDKYPEELEKRLAKLLDVQCSEMLDERLDNKMSLLNSRVEAALNGVHQRLEWVEGTVAELSAAQSASMEQQSLVVTSSPEPDWDLIRTRILKYARSGKTGKTV